MAQNRIYIRCDRCGEERFLAKHFCYGYKLLDDTGAKLNDFFSKHFQCRGDLLDDPPIWDHFSLVYEHPKE